MPDEICKFEMLVENNYIMCVPTVIVVSQREEGVNVLQTLLLTALYIF